MITYKKGNLLEANAQALVNTVNTVGVMGKGIALMFKEKFPENMSKYKDACRNKQVQTGKMFVTCQDNLSPRWIVNFPTKEHWKNPSKMEWIVSGLKDLHQFIIDNNVKSIAIPPLGAGNGGLNWSEVRDLIHSFLGDLEQVDIQVYEPTEQYQNITKNKHSAELTPARALIAELVRRYGVMGIECSQVEIHKLAWFLERSLQNLNIRSPLKLNFKAHYYGPYADNLRHLLNTLDGNFLLSEKRINDSNPFDAIWYNNQTKDKLDKYLASEEMQIFKEALDDTIRLIDGFESPFGMELLATIDWLLECDNCEPNINSLQIGISNWKNKQAAKRKARLFNEKSIQTALNKLEKIKINTTVNCHQSL